VTQRAQGIIGRGIWKALTLCGDFVLSLHTMWIALVPPLVSELHCLLTHALLCLCVCCTCDPITFDPALSCCQVPLSFHRFFCGVCACPCFCACSSVEVEDLRSRKDRKFTGTKELLIYWPRHRQVLLQVARRPERTSRRFKGVKLLGCACRTVHAQSRSLCLGYDGPARPSHRGTYRAIKATVHDVHGKR